MPGYKLNKKLGNDKIVQQKIKMAQKDMAAFLLSIIIFIIIERSVYGKAEEENNVIKQKIINAGCPFVAANQLLEKNVCLMPDYASNELPKAYNWLVTTVKIYLLHVYVMEINENKNQITVEILQYIDWREPRIRANFTTAHSKAKIKVSTKSAQRIWYPDLDIYTKDLKEWKSLYDPLLYQEMYIWNGKNQTLVKLSALKAWKATISCKFDFSYFPFDTQNCAFRQFGSSQNLQLTSNCRGKPAKLKNKPAGFDAFLTSAGAYCERYAKSKTADDQVWMDIGFNITLKRIIRPYLYQYYFPCIAIVVVSQISFMIPITATPGRIALVVTQFLTLTNIFIHQMVRFTSLIE